jgi:small subunit ribosomal protein S1
LVKEDGSNAENGEQLDFRVTEFSKDDRRIVLSHTAVYNKEDESNRNTNSNSSSNSKFAKKAPAAGQGEGKLSDLKKPADKNTLGDLDALSALRDQLAGAERQAGEDKLKARSGQADAKTESETGLNSPGPGAPAPGKSPDNAEIQGA